MKVLITEYQILFREWREIQNHMTGKSKVFTCNVTSFLLYTKCSLLLNAYCNIPAWQNEIQWKEKSQKGKGRWMQGERRKNIKQLNFFFMVQCHGHVPHNSVWWFPVRQAVPSQGHCFSFLYGLHEKRPFSPLRPSTPCVTHIKQSKGPSLCAYCLYTHHMSHHTECHHLMVGTSTSSVGAALQYNVWDASSLSRSTNIRPPQSLSVKKGSVSSSKTCTVKSFM